MPQFQGEFIHIIDIINFRVCSCGVVIRSTGTDVVIQQDQYLDG